MPNWCSSWLVVTGPKKDVAKFKEDAKAVIEYPAEKLSDTFTRPAWTYKSDFSLAKLAPYPKEGDKDDDWYHKRLSYWGTKWDVEAYIQDGNKDLTYSFESAWGPPSEGLRIISSKYPTLKFVNEYDEPGMGFWGFDTCIAGILTEDHHNYTDGRCSNCGNEEWFGNPEQEPECCECGGRIVSVSEYKKLKRKEKHSGKVSVQS